MLEVSETTRINTDAVEDDLQPGEYRDALNISLIANNVRAFSKGTTYGNIDSDIVFKGLQPDAICLGTAIDSAGNRAIITFYQKIPIPYESEYQAVLNYAISRGMSVPSPQVQVAQNFLVLLLKFNGIWVGLDVFYCFFGDGDENFAKINWKLPNDSTIAVNHGMSYLPNYGFKGDGIADYLDTRWNPAPAVKYQPNNAGLLLGVEEVFIDSGGDGCSDGVNGCGIRPYTALNTMKANLNATVDESFVSAEFTDNDGIIFASRTAGAITAMKKNNSLSVAGVAVSAVKPNFTFFIGAINSSGVASDNTSNRYSCFGAGEALSTVDRENKFYDTWELYKNSFVTPLLTESYVQEVLMYMVTAPIVGDQIAPLIKSSNMFVKSTSYLDGYSFVNDLFFFNFRESAPKMINIARAQSSPGFYDNVNETALTVLKPHPPYPPIPVRVVFGPVNPPIQKKPFQFMAVYHFLDGEQSTKSPVSIYLNSLDDRETLTSNYGQIDVLLRFPLKDYPTLDTVELFVRNTNDIGDWRSVNEFKRTLFIQVGSNYEYTVAFFDNVVGNFYPLELANKINDSIPQRSNYLAFIENRIFMIDSLLDYDTTSTFQIKLGFVSTIPEPDDRLAATPLYAPAEFEWDSEYTIGLNFYDKYGRKYPSSENDKKLVTPPFVPVTLPGADALPNQTVFAQLKKAKIQANYELRAAGNIANWGKPPQFAFWWGLIRSKNTKWEFQQSIQCLLRFPYSITKWPSSDPATFPFASSGYLFQEDGYLYWDCEKLLITVPPVLVETLINDYIDVVIPPGFPYPIDNTILIDFMMEVRSVLGPNLTILNREVVEIFANKIRIRGDRNARWFSNAVSGQYRFVPKFTTGVNLNAGKFLLRDETTFPLIFKRRRQNDLASIILYDTPQIFQVQNPGTRFSTFLPQSVTVVRVEYPPLFNAPVLARTLAQGDVLIQPVLLAPTTVATNHKIKITWGPNPPDSLRLSIKVSIWQLNDQNQPIVELYSATGDSGGGYYVKDGETVEYLINADAELINGWYGYGIQILPYNATRVQFENPLFDLQLDGWLQSQEGLSNLFWQWGSTDANYAFVNVSSMLGGWSKSIYQFLNQITKNDLTIEVVVESVGVIGSITNSPTTQYPGNSGVPPVNNATEVLLDQGRNVVPYFIDCTTSPGRVVTLLNLRYTNLVAAPAGTTIRAELWNINQTTKQPISMISAGAAVAVPGGVPPHLAPFAAGTIINTTGWYGIALAIDTPTITDFTDKAYANGATYWITTNENLPTWIFDAGHVPDPVYADVTFTPNFGTNIGYFPMNTNQDIGEPILFTPGTDPAGYDNHRIRIDWGDNISNGWDGQTINVAIWECDFATKKPLTYAPTFEANTTVRSNQVATHFISNAAKLLPNTYYAFGLRKPINHPNPGINWQFTNPSFNTDLGGWSNNLGWVWNGGNGGQALYSASGDFPSSGGANGLGNTMSQMVTVNGYVQMTIPVLNISGNYGVIYAESYLSSVFKQRIDVFNGMAMNPDFTVSIAPWLQNAAFSGGTVPWIWNTPTSVKPNIAGFVSQITNRGARFLIGSDWQQSTLRFTNSNGSSSFSQFSTNGAGWDTTVLVAALQWSFTQFSGYAAVNFTNPGVDSTSSLLTQRAMVINSGDIINVSLSSDVAIGNVLIQFFDEDAGTALTAPTLVNINVGNTDFPLSIPATANSTVKTGVGFRIFNGVGFPTTSGNVGWVRIRDLSVDPGELNWVAGTDNKPVVTIGWPAGGNSDNNRSMAIWNPTKQSAGTCRVRCKFRTFSTVVVTGYLNLLMNRGLINDPIYQGLPSVDGRKALVCPVASTLHEFTFDNVVIPTNGAFLGLWFDVPNGSPAGIMDLAVEWLAVEYLTQALYQDVNLAPSTNQRIALRLDGIRDTELFIYAADIGGVNPPDLLYSNVLFSPTININHHAYPNIVIPNAGRKQLAIYLRGSDVPTLDYLSVQNQSPRPTIPFDAIPTPAGTVISWRFVGYDAVGVTITVPGIYNTFNPYLYSTPNIRRTSVGDPNYDSWINRDTIAIAPVDPDWRNGWTYWALTSHGQVNGKTYFIQENTGVIQLGSVGAVAGAGISTLVYGIIGMEDAAATNFLLSVNGSVTATGGTVVFEVWAFNDPNTFTGTGALVFSQPLGPTAFTLWNLTNVPVTIPGGFKYLGYRWKDNGTNGTFATSLVRFTPVAGQTWNTWYKQGNTLAVAALERELVSLPPPTTPNFHVDVLGAGNTSGRIGQNFLSGNVVSASLELFAGLGANNFDLILSDTNGFELGRTAVVGQALDVQVVTSVTAINPPTTTGLYLSIQNKNATVAISARIRAITNVNTPFTIAADNSIANAKTWQITSVGAQSELATTSLTDVVGTDNVPAPALPITVVLADATGNEISAQQTFAANSGQITLTFSPTLQADLNFNYGVKVKNAPTNQQNAGTIRIHSIQNVAGNGGIANIIANTVDPGNPLYEAWLQFSLGAFARAGYVSNFIAVIDDLQVGPHAPQGIHPTSYHVVANIVPVGIDQHSTNYGGSPDSTYNYGVVYPSASSDPDAAGVVYIEKVGQSIGDINIKIIDLGQKSQSNIVRWSDPVIIGSRTNNLNSFLEANKYSVDFQRGAIQVMIAMHDHTLFCVHKQGMTSLYIQRATMSSVAEGVAQEVEPLFLTSKVIGNDNKLTTNLGTVNPESCRVVESGTIAYGFDLFRKSFWQKTNNGVRNLTYECNAKKLFNSICFYRLKAYAAGEDVKIYSGYNEKQKTFYLTFAPFTYNGKIYPAVTVGYNSYIDGFISRYSFEPLSYLATEDTLHSIKARELTNPDFFGSFDFWLTNNANGGTADWQRSTLLNGSAEADTTVPPGTRIVNPDFSQGPTFWSAYGGGSVWAFVNDGAETAIPAAGFSKDLVNSSGAPATYRLRVSAKLPVTGLNYSIKVYDGLGGVLEVLLPDTPMTGNDVVQVTQTLAGRIGVIIHNTSGGVINVHLNLFSTVVKTFLLYQPMPIGIENLRLRLIIPERLGSMNAFIYTFNDPLSPLMTLLGSVDLINNKGLYSAEVIVPNGVSAKYVGIFTVTDYDQTLLQYFNVNSVPSVWIHDQAGRTNNFFGVQYDSMIDLVFNVRKGQVRIFNSFGIESDTVWSVQSIKTSEGQLSALSEENFRLRDGVYYATIMRDMLTPQDALPNPATNTPLMHGTKMMGVFLEVVIRNDETLRQIELRAVYLGSDELAGNFLNKK